MEKEWRMNPNLSGGGELLDQGVHLIDLALFFKGIPKTVFGSVGKLVWNSDVEDSASFILQYDNNINCLFSVGWVYWKNKFEFNIYGSHGFISINGLGGSYGEEKLVLGHRNFEGGKPKIESFSFSAEKSILNDDSWTKEWKFFRKLIQNKNFPTIIMMHHPPMFNKKGPNWISLDEKSTNKLQSELEKKEILAIMCGHIHINQTNFWNGIPVIISNGLYSTVDLLNRDDMVILEGKSFNICYIRENGIGVSVIPLKPKAKIFRKISLKKLKNLN